MVSGIINSLHWHRCKATNHFLPHLPGFVSLPSFFDCSCSCVSCMCIFFLGEDRWLCTLLLQQGWRVEYNAASDAYTNSPQEFKEFYNQRKRWGPSTLANTLDLLHRLLLFIISNSGGCIHGNVLKWKKNGILCCVLFFLGFQSHNYN